MLCKDSKDGCDHTDIQNYTAPCCDGQKPVINICPDT